MKRNWLLQPVTRAWLFRAQPPSGVGRLTVLLGAVLLPGLAAGLQSLWVLWRGTRLYQAMIGGDAGPLVWAVLSVQTALSLCALWPLLKYPVLHRSTAFLLFCLWLWLDFVANSAVHR